MKKLVALMLVLLMLPVSGLALDVSNMIHVDKITEEPVTLTIMACVNSAIESWKDNTVMNEYEKKTGVHVEWIEISGSDIEQQIQLTLAGGDTPDIILFYTTTPVLQTYGPAGVVMPLNDLIENYTVNAKQQLIDNPKLKKLMTAPDGNIYSMWMVWENPNEAILNKQFLFLPWFEKYSAATGAGMPETLDEYRAMLEYFRDNDMNGNGDATDEIPLLGNQATAQEGGSALDYIMNAFQLWNCADYYHVTDEGELVFEANTQAFRDGLSYMNKMYEDGLYPEEDFILNLGDYRNITNAPTPEEICVGVAAAPFYMRCITQSIYNRAYIDFEALPPLKNYYNPEIRETHQRFDAMYKPQSFICSTCENPEVAIQWLDYWLGEEGTMLTVLYGIEGRDWEWTDEFPSLAGNTPSILIKATLENSGNKDVPSHTGVPNYMSKELFEATSADPNSSGRTYADYRAHLNYAPYAKMGNIPELIWCPDEDILIEYSELNTVIEEYVRASYASFVLGNTDIDNDADWQAYLDQLDALGLERYMEVIKAYIGL